MPSLPTPSQTYRYRVNYQCAEADDLLHRQRLLFEIVQTLLGLGTGWTDSAGATLTAPISTGWAVYSSCDSVAVDTTNRWEALADLVWAAELSAHSWIVLVHDDYFGTATPLYMLINCSQGGAHRNATLGVYLSRNEFTDGSTTERPTATDEVEVLPSDGSMVTAPWQGTDDSTEDARTGRLHCIISSDGRCFRAVICRLGADVAWLDLFRDLNYDLAEWDFPAMMTVASIDLGDPFFTVDNINGTAWYHTRDGVSVAASFTLAPTCTVDGATAITELDANSGTGESGWDSIKLSARAPGAGLRSAIPDIWWGRTAEPDASFGTTRAMQQFTNLVVTWNGSVVEKT